MRGIPPTTSATRSTSVSLTAAPWKTDATTSGGTTGSAVTVVAATHPPLLPTAIGVRATRPSREGLRRRGGGLHSGAEVLTLPGGSAPRRADRWGRSLRWVTQPTHGGAPRFGMISPAAPPVHAVPDRPPTGGCHRWTGPPVTGDGRRPTRAGGTGRAHRSPSGDPARRDARGGDAGHRAPADRAGLRRRRRGGSGGGGQLPRRRLPRGRGPGGDGRRRLGRGRRPARGQADPRGGRAAAR